MDHFAKKASKIAKAMYQAARDPDQYQQPGVQQGQPQYGQQHTYQAPPNHTLPSSPYIQQGNYGHVVPPAPYGSPSYVSHAAQTPTTDYVRPTTSGGPMSMTTASNTSNSNHAYDLPPPLPDRATQHWVGGIATQSPIGSTPWAPSPIHQIGTPMSIGPAPSPPHMNNQGYFAPHGLSGSNSVAFTGGLPLPAVNQSSSQLPPITNQPLQAVTYNHYPSPISSQENGVISSTSANHQQGYQAPLPAMQQGMYYASKPQPSNQSPSHYSPNTSTSFPGTVPPPPPYSHGPPKLLGHSGLVAELPAESQTYFELPAEPVHRPYDSHNNASAPLQSSPLAVNTITHSRTGSAATDSSKPMLPPPINYSSHPNNTSAQAYTNLPDPLGPASPQPLVTASAQTSLQKLEQPKPVHPEQTAKATAEQIASITPLSPQPQSVHLPPGSSISSMLTLTPLPPPLSAPVGTSSNQFPPLHNPMAYTHPTSLLPSLQHQPLPHMPYPQHPPQPPQQQYSYLPPPPVSMPPMMRDQYGNVLPPIQHLLPQGFDGSRNPNMQGPYG